MTTQKNISRRSFLKTSGGVALLIGSSGLLQLVACKRDGEIVEDLDRTQLTAWVHLRPDGQITIYNPASEMGQGAMTSLPLIFAEEMDADWSKVHVEFSPQDPEIYGSDWGSRKMMLAVGSRTTAGYYPIMRQAGAQARALLMQSVAEEWQVPVEELSTKPSIVVHEASGRKINYADILPILKVPETIAEVPENQLKNPKDFRLIGKADIQRYDIPAKVDGSAQFAMDVQLPDMLYAVMQRGKVHGAKPSLKNRETVTALEGVVGVVELEHGVGIIAHSFPKALAARDALEIEWSEAEATGFNSQEAYEQYAKVAAEKKEGRVLNQQGDVRQTLRAAAKTYSVDYKNDYVYHAQMEPVNAVVKVAADGQSAEVWVGSQGGPSDKAMVAEALGLDQLKVTVNLQYLGGGLGRRSRGDYTAEAARLAKTVAPRPVKLIWTREDDLQYGMYRPLSLQRMIAGTDAAGNLTGLAHYVIGDGDSLLASGIRNEFYDIPNQHQEIRIVPSGVRVKHWRSVGHGPNKFAIESMIDEVAADQGVDPVEFRRRLMKNSPRALATLEKAAEMANWGGPVPEGRARGVAFLERSGTLSTGICEISVDESTGKIRVHHFWSANDAGVVVHPDNAIAQVEGGIVMGMSSVLKEQLTIVNGETQQSNFHDYQLLRMEDIPESIETTFISSAESPKGVGESGTPLVAGAIANAFAALTGKRLRHLPFTPERVREVLAS